MSLSLSFCLTLSPYLRLTLKVNHATSAMFRLSKGNQSRKNHKIIHQTTKVSETDAPLSTPAVNAAHHEAEQARLAEVESERVRQIELQEQEATSIVTTAAAVTEQIINEHVMTQLVRLIM